LVFFCCWRTKNFFIFQNKHDRKWFGHFDKFDSNSMYEL